MWLLFPIVSVMIRAIIGSSDVENVNRVQLKLGNVSQAIIPDRIQMYDSNLSRTPPMGHDSMTQETNYQKIIQKRSAEELNTDLWNSLHKNEILSDDSLPYLQLNERSLPSSAPDFSQENKTPAFDSWGGKRVAPSGSKSQRPFRMSFSSWGGKRSQGYANDKAYFLINKDNKSFLDKDAEKNFLEYAKRLLNNGWSGRRTPFHSWGGKRNSETEFHMDKNVENSVIPEAKVDLYLPEDTLSDEGLENNISENTENEKGAAQAKNNGLQVGFNSWGGNRNRVEDYRSILSDGSSSFGNAIEKNINAADRLPLSVKGTTKRYTKKSYFQPWIEKQSANAQAEIIPNNYAVHNIRPMKERVLFSWCG